MGPVLGVGLSLSLFLLPPSVSTLPSLSLGPGGSLPTIVIFLFVFWGYAIRGWHLVVS